MRRLLAIILAATMLFLLCSCKKQPTTQPLGTTQPTQSTSPTASNNNEYEQKPMYAVSFASQIEETTDTSGKVRFRYSYQNMSLVLPEAEIADRIILDFLNRMDQADQYAETVRDESLLDEYDNMGIPFMYDISYTPNRFDTVLLSLCKNEIEYKGWIHPNNYSSAVTYDLLNGNILNLSDVLKEDITAEDIADSVIAGLSNTKELWTGYDVTIREIFAAGLNECNNWYFTDSGLCFHFDPYVIASYFTGPIIVELPYSELVGTLRDEYFPAEQDSYRGNLVVEKFTVDAQEDFTQFAEVVMVEGGTKLLLSADGAVTNITIETEEITSGITITAMAVHSLTPGDAIMVEFDPATTKLLVSYRNGDQYETKTITCNQDNISIS